uniref:Uncharacterized protein n=1 Tax=Rousettus aegyptiacus TaxID=9407 RepID=A0A7J8H181_ROUAE|nr:hypothetical protein HJG63_011285 [Rousettus aegyptiacus]
MKALYFPATALQKLSIILRVRFKTCALIHNVLCNMASAPWLWHSPATLVGSALEHKEPFSPTSGPLHMLFSLPRALFYFLISLTTPLHPSRSLSRLSCLPESVNLLVIIPILPCMFTTPMKYVTTYVIMPFSFDRVTPNGPNLPVMLEPVK